MLRYEINPSDLDEENQYLVSANREILDKLHELVKRHLEEIEPDGRVTKEDNDVLQQRFQVLMAMAIQHGLDAGDIADRLGITVSTVHRWAKGSFVPSQLFVRAAAMRGVEALLKQELADLQAQGKEVAVPERYLPPTGGLSSDNDGNSPASVLPFESSKGK